MSEKFFTTSSLLKCDCLFFKSFASAKCLQTIFRGMESSIFLGKPLSKKSKIQASMQNFSSKFLFRHFCQAKYKQKNCFAKHRWKRRNKGFLRKAFKKQVNLKGMFKNLQKFKAVWIFTNKRTDNCLFNEYFVLSHISFRRNQKKSLITLSPRVCAQTIFCWDNFICKTKTPILFTNLIKLSLSTQWVVISCVLDLDPLLKSSYHLSLLIKTQNT